MPLPSVRCVGRLARDNLDLGRGDELARSTAVRRLVFVLGEAVRMVLTMNRFPPS